MLFRIIISTVLLSLMPTVILADGTRIVKESGVVGGIVVHLNCGDGSMTATLRPDERYLVQGLQSDATALTEARKTVMAAGQYGPADMPRRLVSVGDRVYVTLGLKTHVTCLDTLTGKTIKEYPSTQNTEEILYDDGVIYTLTGTVSLILMKRNSARRKTKMSPARMS